MSEDFDTPTAPMTIGANAPEISVSELSQALKRTVEDHFGRVRVRGEISNYRGPHSSGHAYFSLKDESARIDAVIWKGVMLKLRTRPQEGLEVLATGRITTFPGKSSYQIIIENLEPAGVGALMALLDARRRQLATEGLFDESRKKPIPFLPETIGVITSPTGAVIRDILHRIAERFPRRILVWPVRVQGETAAAEITTAIEGFNALPPQGEIPRPDLIIVARGGGSLEDLWSFNEENVVRAAAASIIPLISAIGHETDTTLIDFVADLRAPTPTAAAEKSVPVRDDLITALSHHKRRLISAWERLTERRKLEINNLSRLLLNADVFLATPRQRLDRNSERLNTFIFKIKDDRRLKLARCSSLLDRHSPQVELARMSERLHGLIVRLKQSMLATIGAEKRNIENSTQLTSVNTKRLELALTQTIKKKREYFHQLSHLLETLSHQAALGRGYALVRNNSGALIRSVTQTHKSEMLFIDLSDGQLTTQITDAPQDRKAKEPTARKKTTQEKEDLKQGKLF